MEGDDLESEIAAIEGHRLRLDLTTMKMVLAAHTKKKRHQLRCRLNVILSLFWIIQHKERSKNLLCRCHQRSKNLPQRNKSLQQLPLRYQLCKNLRKHHS